MVRMWRACVRPINRTNGGLTARCALREEDPPVAAGGWAKRTGGARRRRGRRRKRRGWGQQRKKKREPEAGTSCGLQSPIRQLLQCEDPCAAWIYSYIREDGSRKGKHLKMALNKSTHMDK